MSVICCNGKEEEPLPGIVKPSFLGVSACAGAAGAAAMLTDTSRGLFALHTTVPVPRGPATCEAYSGLVIDSQARPRRYFDRFTTVVNLFPKSFATLHGAWGRAGEVRVRGRRYTEVHEEEQGMQEHEKDNGHEARARGRAGNARA